MKSCVCPPRVAFLFPPVLWSFCDEAPLTFKAKCSGGSSSQFQIPILGSLTWGSELSLLWENLCDIIILVCGSPTWWVWDLIISRMEPSYHLIVASFLSLEVDYLFGRFQSFFVDGHSAVSFDFGVFVRWVSSGPSTLPSFWGSL